MKKVWGHNEVFDFLEPRLEVAGVPYEYYRRITEVVVRLLDCADLDARAYGAALKNIASTARAKPDDAGRVLYEVKETAREVLSRRQASGSTR